LWPDAIDLGDNAYWLIVFSVMTGLAGRDRRAARYWRSSPPQALTATRGLSLTFERL
jgi:hypothetical protein